MALTKHSTLEMGITTIIVKRKSVEFSMHLTNIGFSNQCWFKFRIWESKRYMHIWNDSVFTVSFVDLSDNVEICIQVSNWKKR